MQARPVAVPPYGPGGLHLQEDETAGDASPNFLAKTCRRW